MLEKADGTVVFSLDPILSGGSALTFEYATKVKKPRIHIHKSATDYSEEAFPKEVSRLKDFIESNQIVVLNVGSARIRPAWRLCVCAQDASRVLEEPLRPTWLIFRIAYEYATPLPCRMEMA